MIWLIYVIVLTSYPNRVCGKNYACYLNIPYTSIQPDVVYVLVSHISHKGAFFISFLKKKKFSLIAGLDLGLNSRPTKVDMTESLIHEHLHWQPFTQLFTRQEGGLIWHAQDALVGLYCIIPLGELYSFIYSIIKAFCGVVL